MGVSFLSTGYSIPCVYKTESCQPPLKAKQNKKTKKGLKNKIKKKGER